MVGAIISWPHSVRNVKNDRKTIFTFLNFSFKNSQKVKQNAVGRIYRVVCAAFPTHVCEQNVACSNVCAIPVDQLVWILGTPFEMVFWVGIRETNATCGGHSENN